VVAWVGLASRLRNRFSGVGDIHAKSHHTHRENAMTSVNPANNNAATSFFYKTTSKSKPIEEIGRASCRERV